MSVIDVEPNQCQFECPECLLKYSAVPSVAHADWDACPRCVEDDFQYNMAPFTVCPNCRGAGSVVTNWRPAPDTPQFLERAICGECKGARRVLRESAR